MFTHLLAQYCALEETLKGTTLSRLHCSTAQMNGGNAPSGYSVFRFGIRLYLHQGFSEYG